MKELWNLEEPSQGNIVICLMKLGGLVLTPSYKYKGPQFIDYQSIDSNTFILYHFTFYVIHPFLFALAYCLGARGLESIERAKHIYYKVSDFSPLNPFSQTSPRSCSSLNSMAWEGKCNPMCLSQKVPYWWDQIVRFSKIMWANLHRKCCNMQLYELYVMMLSDNTF